MQRTPAKRRFLIGDSTDDGPYRMTIDRTNIAIIDALVNDPNMSSREISQRLKVPLSTIQRRRSILERSVLLKQYQIDIREFGWRTADLFLSVGKGNSEKIAELLLTKPNVLSVSTRVGNPEINVAAQFFFRDSQELHRLIEEVKAIGNVERVEWSEVVKLTAKKQKIGLFDLIFGSDSGSSL